MKLGAQMYTVREFTQNEKDIAETFKKIAKIGYETVQVSAIGDILAHRLDEIAKENNIEIVVTHTNQDRILNDTEKVIEEHKIFGCKHIGIGSMPQIYQKGGLDGIKAFIKDYEKAANIIADNGLKLHYHNHAFEFERYGNITGFDYMVEHMDKNLWGFILDTYWVHYAGCDAAEYVNELRGRIDVLHLKDMKIINNEQKMAAVFEGNMPFSAIIKAAMSTGVPYAMVEQDDCGGENPFDMLKLSYKNLVKVGLN